LENDKKKDLFALASIPLIMTLSNSMLIPILPAIRRQLGVSSLQTSLLITVYSVMAIILIPIAGYLSDRYGRKKVIIPSLIVAGVGGAICGVAAWMGVNHAYGIILSGRLLQGIGAAGAMPIVLPLVGDMFKSDEQVSSGLGLIETANTFGKVLSPVLGTLLAAIIWYVPFVAIPILCLASVLLVAFLVKTPKKKDAAPPVPLKTFVKSTAGLLKANARWLSAIFAIGGIGMFLIFGLLFYLSESLEDRAGLKGVLKGSVLAIPLAVLCTASYLTGKWIGDRQRLMKWLTVSGFGIAALSILVCCFINGIALQIACLCVAGLGIGTALPCLDALLTEGVEKEQRGTITAFYSSLRFAGVAAGPPAASVLMRFNDLVLFGSMAAVAAIGTAVALFAIRPEADNSAKTERAPFKSVKKGKQGAY